MVVPQVSELDSSRLKLHGCSLVYAVPDPLGATQRVFALAVISFAGRVVKVFMKVICGMGMGIESIKRTSNS